jgi:acyl-CoA synthetase (AMP-forming)/AMP-acid ligase II
VPTLDALVSANGGEVVDGDRRLSHAQMEALVARVAGGLAARGVRRGHAVAWQLPNGLAAAALYRACWRIGAVAAPVLHSLGRADMEFALGQVDPALTVELAADKVSDPDALLALLDGEPVPAGAVPVRPSDLAVVLFTSGSSGEPKAVLHTHRGLSWKASLMVGVHGLGAADAVLMPAPLAHVSGLLNGVLVPGAGGLRAVLVRRFDPADALALVARERVSFLAGPPTFFVAMAALLREDPGAWDPSSIRLVSSGGASVTPAFVEATAAAFSCRVKRTYGSTEAPTVTTSTDDDPVGRAAETDGRAVGEVELRVSDPATGAELATGEAGELWVRGPELFCGYADPGPTAIAITSDGWFRTGDLATVDADGWLRIVGRLKDVIVRGGEKIAASEVESALESHPSIHQAVAVGYPDELMGERVVAFIVADGEFGVVDCGRWFEARGMARFKTPERVVRLPHLPLLGSGKPDRAELRRRAAEGHGADG